MRFVWLLCLYLLVPAVWADTLLIEAIEGIPPNTADGLPRPRLGMSMAAVESRFGAPELEIPAVGEPPITRWFYDRFTVYFEQESVLRAVVHR